MNHATFGSRTICERLFANPCDDAAWIAFYNRYWHVAYSWAAAHKLRRVTAEDIATAVFERLYFRITDPGQPPVEFPESGTFKGFVIQVTRNLLRDHLRSSASKRRVEATDAELAILADEASMADLGERLTAQVCLDMAIAHFAERYGEALVKLKADPQFNPQTFQVFLRVYRDGNRMCDVDTEFGYKDGGASRAANRHWERLMALMEWTPEEVARIPGREILLGELVKAYGDLSD